MEGVTLLQKSSRCILQPLPTGQFSMRFFFYFLSYFISSIQWLYCFEFTILFLVDSLVYHEEEIFSSKSGRCLWSNGCHCMKWTYRTEFKSCLYFPLREESSESVSVLPVQQWLNSKSDSTFSPATSLAERKLRNQTSYTPLKKLSLCPILTIAGISNTCFR